MQGTKHFGIHYAAESDLDLAGFTDSNWEGDNINQKSTYGYVFMFGNGPIFCSRKNKDSISLSSIESEY